MIEITPIYWFGTLFISSAVGFFVGLVCGMAYAIRKLRAGHGQQT